MKKKYTLMLWTFLVQGILCFLSAQNDNTVPKLPDVIPPSPQSYVFQQFKGFAPDLSTGAVNVSIPLHTLTIGDFSLPLTLSYNNNGIKVGDPSRPLGYGWVLHPGLRITRTVMGRADESYPNKGYMDEPICDSLLWSAYMEHQNKDTQYDIFTLSLPEGNVRFLLRNISSPGSPSWEVLSLTNPYRITPLYTGYKLYAFKVLDDKGIEYHFGKSSATSGVNDYVEVAEGTSDITAYFLKNVTLPDGEVISFTWNSYSDTYSYVFALSRIELDYLFRFDFSESGSNDDTFVTSYDSNTYLNVGAYQTCSLSSIQSSKFKVEYTYSGSALHSILISDGMDTPVKPIVFSVSDDLLQSVTINNDEVYSFEYDFQRFDNSDNDVYRAVDYWGYYNGNSNSRMYPSLSYDYYTVTDNYTRNWTKLSAVVSGGNLNPNESKAQANILRKIVYPTGGYSEYEYEMNLYNQFTTFSPYPMKMNKGGGLRVKSITSRASSAPDARIIRREYRYGQNEDGYGECTVEPSAETFVRESFYQEDSDPGSGYAYRQLAFVPKSMIAWYFMFAAPVWYDKVTEYIGDVKTEYTYDYDFIDQLHRYNYPDEILQLQNTESSGIRHYTSQVVDFPFSGLQFFYNLNGQGPLLTSRTFYDKVSGDYVRRQKDVYSYSPYYLKNHHAYNMYNMYVEPINSQISEQNSQGDQYAWLKSHVQPRVYLKSSESVTEYSYSAGQSESITDFLYDDYGNLRYTLTRDSNGNMIKDEYLYSDSDLELLSGMGSTSFVSLMQESNHVTAPVGFVQRINDEVTFRKMTSYLGSPYLQPSKEYYDYGDGTAQRMSYEKYNSHGRLQFVVRDGLEETVILWGYGSEHPVAVIRNATYLQVESVLGASSIARIESSLVLSESDALLLDSLREALPDAMVETFTYIPLVGVSSHTDPSGLETLFEYDSSERLSGIYQTDRTTGQSVRLEKYEYDYDNVLEL